jgi:hypothetical protein
MGRQPKSGTRVVGSSFGYLEGLRSGEALFYQEITSFAEQHRALNPVKGDTALSHLEIGQLRSVGISDIAYFLYMMRATGLNRDPRRLQKFLRGHNASLSNRIAELRSNKRAYTQSGLTISRLSAGILEEYQIEALVSEAADQGVRYDQSTLGCLLIEAMAPESCRLLLVLLHKCGLINRHGTSSKTIRSIGFLEDAYGRYLRQVGDKVTGNVVR